MLCAVTLSLLCACDEREHRDGTRIVSTSDDTISIAHVSTDGSDRYFVTGHKSDRAVYWHLIDGHLEERWSGVAEDLLPVDAECFVVLTPGQLGLVRHGIRTSLLDVQKWLEIVALPCCGFAVLGELHGETIRAGMAVFSKGGSMTASLDSAADRFRIATGDRREVIVIPKDDDQTIALSAVFDESGDVKSHQRAVEWPARLRCLEAVGGRPVLTPEFFEVDEVVVGETRIELPSTLRIGRPWCINGSCLVYEERSGRLSCVSLEAPEGPRHVVTISASREMSLIPVAGSEEVWAVDGGRAWRIPLE